MPVIVLEGLDNCGKSTQAKHLKFNYANSMILREPGSTPIAERIRSLVKDESLRENETMYLNTQALLMFAARSQLVQLIKTLEHRHPGILIILDRWIFSTYVYQCMNGNFPFEYFDSLVRMSQADTIVPDGIILMENSGIIRPPSDAIEKEFVNKREAMVHQYQSSLSRTNFQHIFPYYKNIDPDNIITLDIEGRTEEETFEPIQALVERIGV